MRAWVSKNWFYICLIALSITGVAYGLADQDYFWQADLGRQIIKNGDFNGCYNQVWGSLGVTEYYDHEWLTNIIFYFFSLIPYKPVMFLKLFICILSGLEFSRFLRFKKVDEQSFFKRVQILVLFTLYILIFCKVKAYALSCLFLLEEIILLDKWCESKKMSCIVKLLVLCIFWTNMHSGSMPLFFAVAGVYWLLKVDRQDKPKVASYGVVMALSTLLNPYGYKLLIFNFEHNFDSTMKTYVLDWKGMDAKTSLGFLCCCVMIYYIVLLVNTKKHNIANLVISLALVYMSCSSVRHMIYLIPFIMVALIDCNLDFSFNIDLSYVLVFCCGLSLVVAISTFTTADYGLYEMNYVDAELEAILLDAPEEGLFNSCADVSMTRYGGKDFVTGGYPMVSARVKDSLIMSQYGSYDQIAKIIDYYGLTDFVLYKYNNKVEFYLNNTPLYDYLRSNPNYEQLYDSEQLAYFRVRG